MSKAFEKIKAGLEEAIAVAKGEAEPARVYQIQCEPASAKARSRTQ